MDKEINYEDFLKCEEWSLDTSISLINGEKPHYPNNEYILYLEANRKARFEEIIDELKAKNSSEYEYKGISLNKFQDKKITIINKENLSYKKAITDITSKRLVAKKRDYELVGDKKIFYESEMYFIKPRDFIKWCNEKDIHVNPELNKFFNYDYWLFHRKYWGFDEAVMVILSKDVPSFPHEIENVFEKDDEHFYFTTTLKKLIDDWSNQIQCYKSDENGDLVEFMFSSKFHNVQEVFFEKKNLLLELKKEIAHRDSCLKNNKLKINSKIIDNYASELLEKEEQKEKDIKSILDKIDVKDGEKIYNQLLSKLPKESDTVSLQDCFNSICGIKFCPFGIYVDDSHLIDALDFPRDLNWLKKRYEHRQIYQEQFFKDLELRKINFVVVGDVSDSKERLYAKVLFKDFLSWADGHKMPIPPEPKIKETKNLETRTKPELKEKIKQKEVISAFRKMANEIKKHHIDKEAMWDYLWSMAEQENGSFKNKHSFLNFKIDKDAIIQTIRWSTHNSGDPEIGTTMSKKTFFRNYSKY